MSNNRDLKGGEPSTRHYNRKEMKATHFSLGSDTKPEGKSIMQSMSDPSYSIPQNYKKHVQMAHESNKTHFKLSPSSNKINMTSTQRHAFRTENSQTIQPTINTLKYKKTHFKIGFHQPSFETSYNNSFTHGNFKNSKI
jgi:hypothetical protein